MAAGFILPLGGALAAPPAAAPARATLAVTATVEPSCSVSTAPSAQGEETPVRVSCSADAGWTAQAAPARAPARGETRPLRTRTADGYVTVTY